MRYDLLCYRLSELQEVGLDTVFQTLELHGKCRNLISGVGVQRRIHSFNCAGIIWVSRCSNIFEVTDTRDDTAREFLLKKGLSRE